MSIFKTPYDTSAFGGHHLDQIRNKVKEAVIMGHVSVNDDGIYVVTGTSGIIKDIPAFAHPIGVEMDHGTPEGIVVDLRSYTSEDKLRGGWRITDEAGYSMATLRGVLTKKFAGEYGGTLRSFSTVPINVYSAMIADSATSRLSLDYSMHLKIQQIASIYYLSLFEDKLKSTDKAFIDSTSLYLARALSHQASDIKQILEILKDAQIELDDIDTFCTAVKTVITNVRVRDLNYVTLAAMLGGYWFGPLARELINVSLEHPPTLLALVYHAYQDRSFRSTKLANLVEKGYLAKQKQAYTGAIKNM